ncbi:MAG: hypothetical protein NVS3B18_08020 [Candidatus Dormibacteria bacterium]
MSTGSPPHQRLGPPVAVLVHLAAVDDPYRGIVEGWRGDRVKVMWSSAGGLKHGGWLPASSVTRVDG